VGAVGAPFDNAMVESFWARMQVELLDRRKWKTRVELATVIHDYIEIWHNTSRRHSALNMLTPTEFENQHTTTTKPPELAQTRSNKTGPDQVVHQTGSTPDRNSWKHGACH
jgi:hypothetical protein